MKLHLQKNMEHVFPPKKTWKDDLICQLKPGTVFNHLVFHLSFHYSPDRSDAARIVGFIVEPKVRPLDEANCEDLDVAPTLDLENCTSLTFTYDVIWTESTTTWSERWDNYVSKVGTKIRWYATIQNMCVVACTLCLVATILVRTLRLDGAKSVCFLPRTNRLVDVYQILH